MNILLRSSLVFGLLFAAISPAVSHRGHDALSVVTVAPDGHITVSHRFEAHDIEPALATIAPNAQANLDDPDAQKALVAYLANNFGLTTRDGPVVLTPGVHDFGSDIVRIEFTGKARRAVKRLNVRSRLLNEIYPGQASQVNVRFGKILRTLTFVDDGPQSVEIK